ncbi:MAG: hypothetical protein H0V46_01105 [Sphingomonas sp.]|nr:hypothetical protein [Sphingomonas sp.]
MPAGLSVAIAWLALAAPGAAAQRTPPPQSAALAANQPCRTTVPSADATEIIVCAERPQGYRLNPDVMEAKRQVRSQPQRRSNDHMKDTNCASVGPAGCIAGPTVNLLVAVPVALAMAGKAIRGENVGNMFVTRPEMSEYELYVAAKRKREAAEAAAAKAAASPRTESASKP